MIPFLKNLARTYYKVYAHEISEYTFVFPNRRAGIFFQKYLAEIARRPIFSPRITTISDLFLQLSPLKIADRIEMLFTLYNIYKNISNSADTFEEFMFWGEMVLSDFDDADKFMADARQLFRNVYDLREIDSGLSYLTEEQIAAIRRFWSNFHPLGDSPRKKEFLEMWEVLPEMYLQLRKELRQKGLAYEGMLYRDIAEKIKAKEDIPLPPGKIIIAGLNAQTKCEETLLLYLQQQGIADFYWDYSSPLVKDADNKASFFIDRNKMLFPSKLLLEPEELAMEKPLVEVIGIPSLTGQAKYIHRIIENLIEEKAISKPEDSLNTAVVLPDENMLLPVLYSIPEKIERINVTMGYSLSNSSISGLMEHIFNIQRNIRITDGNIGYYFRFVLPVLNHKYITHITGQDSIQLRKDILQNNRIIVPYDDLKKNPFLALVFQPVNHWTEIADYLKNILARIQHSLLLAKEDRDMDANAGSTDIEREFIIEYYKTINKMEEALKNVDAEMNPDTYFKLLKRLAANISVPFSGEPVSGLQVMGVLETRALDFENVIILSANEGIFPQKKSWNSFIPYNLRKGFGLPTYEYQDAIYAYHFYRLINRAKRVYLLYDTRTEGLQTGEISRYFHQIKHLYNNSFEIREKLAVYEVSSTHNEPVSIKKTQHILDKLEDFSTGERNLSASAINTYLDCPLQFYFSVVEGMQDEDEIAETVESNTFGSIFHSVMEWIYEPLEGKMVTADLLHKLQKDDKLLTTLLEKSFAKNYFKIDETNPKKLTGQNYLTAEVLKRYVKKVLQTDARLTPFIYLQSEKRIVRNYSLPSGKNVSLKGFIDRIDEVNGRTRIIDYKTGKGLVHYKSMENLFDKSLKDRPKAIMQVFMYTHLFQEEYPDKIPQPGIYFLRHLFDEKFEPCIFHRPAIRESNRIEDFTTCRSEFKKLFDSCLEEIFDPLGTFGQTPTGKACEWCKFTGICKK